VPFATEGSAMIACIEAMSESRPNNAMNQGRPAAGIQRSDESPTSCNRSAARSSIARS
jgi:hypothetical protein